MMQKTSYKYSFTCIEWTNILSNLSKTETQTSISDLPESSDSCSINDNSSHDNFVPAVVNIEPIVDTTSVHESQIESSSPMQQKESVLSEEDSLSEDSLILSANIDDMQF